MKRIYKVRVHFDNYDVITKDFFVVTSSRLKAKKTIIKWYDGIASHEPYKYLECEQLTTNILVGAEVVIVN